MRNSRLWFLFCQRLLPLCWGKAKEEGDEGQVWKAQLHLVGMVSQLGEENLLESEAPLGKEV